jgi:AraC-like DNA-binding protein
VSGNSSSPPSTVIDATFHSMEEVNEVTHTTGWSGEFGQLSKGRVTSSWRSLHLGSNSLISHRLDRRIHVRQAPPKGCLALAIMPAPYFMTVDGAEFGSDRVLVIGANSEVDLVTADEGVCKTFVVPECDFEAGAQALFPRFRMPINGELTGISPCSSSGWSALHGEVTELLRNGSVSPEDLSHLLSRFLGLIAGEPEKLQRELRFGNRSTARVAKRAQEYIEDHYPHRIRMEDLCRCIGVSLRTLQRSFSDYFQVSPSEYIKARRLNAARLALVAGEPSRDRVTRIAIDNGFTHLGRFSVGYRAHFDESPKETLARGKLSKI